MRGNVIRLVSDCLQKCTLKTFRMFMFLILTTINNLICIDRVSNVFTEIKNRISDNVKSRLFLSDIVRDNNKYNSSYRVLLFGVKDN